MAAVSYIPLDGRRRSTAPLRGKATLVNFWATRCTSCGVEMLEVEATHQRFKDRGYDTVATAMRYDPPARVAHFAESRQLPFRAAIDSASEIAKHFGDVQLTPTSLLIGKRGNIVQCPVGTPDFAAMRQLID